MLYLKRMSKSKDVVINISKKHPQTGEMVPPGKMYVVGTLAHKTGFIELEEKQLNYMTNEELQRTLYEKIHSRH